MDSDANRIRAIIRYCKRIEEMKEEFGKDIEDFMTRCRISMPARSA
jgi:predicted nucleotidyltransferase